MTIGGKKHSITAYRSFLVREDRQRFDIYLIFSDSLIGLSFFSNAEYQSIAKLFHVIRAGRKTRLDGDQIVYIYHRIDLIKPFPLADPADQRF